MVMGGSSSHSDEALRRVHAPHSISRTGFRRMTDLLQETMENFGLQPDDVKQVMSEIMRREVFIITCQD
jgi:truncated hemoglobin YjbI